MDKIYEIAEVPKNNVITNKDIERLTQNKWLNDTCINAITHLIWLDFPRPDKNQAPLFYIMDTAFFSFLIGPNGEKKYNYDSVKGFTQNRKLNYNAFDCRKIFVPVNVGNYHWALLVIELYPPDLVYIYMYDSLNLFHFVHENIVRWIHDEVQHLPLWDPEGLCVHEKKVNVRSMQVNDYDCGVYVCAAILRIAEHNEPEFQPEYIKNLRKKFAADIVNYRGDTIHKLKKLINW